MKPSPADLDSRAGAPRGPMHYLASAPGAVPAPRDHTSALFIGSPHVPKRNYNQAKRQREASREQKKEQKRQRKLERINTQAEDESTSETDLPEQPRE